MGHGEYVREALDQSELVDDLAALVLDVLLGLFELLMRGILCKCDLQDISKATRLDRVAFSR